MARARRSRQYCHLRDRDYEPPAPVTDIGNLLHDLVPDVPGKDQHVVGARVANFVRVKDRYPGPRQVATLLVRAAVHGEIKEVRAHTAVVEQRISLRRRAVADDALAVILDAYQKLEQAALGTLDLVVERGVGADGVEPCALLLVLH